MREWKDRKIERPSGNEEKEQMEIKWVRKYVPYK